MKKLLATVLSVVLALTMVLGTALADETVIAEGNADVTEAVTGAPEGSKLVITAEYAPNERPDDPVPASGWGVGGIVIDGSWGPADSEFQATITADPVEGDKITTEFDCDALKKAYSGGIQVNYYNGFVVRKVVLQTPAASSGDGKGGEGQGDAQGDGKGGDAPKTADTMTVVLFAGVAILALGAVVASKKARA